MIWSFFVINFYFGKFDVPTVEPNIHACCAHNPSLFDPFVSSSAGPVIPEARLSLLTGGQLYATSRCC